MGVGIDQVRSRGLELWCPDGWSRAFSVLHFLICNMGSTVLTFCEAEDVKIGP